MSSIRRRSALRAATAVLALVLGLSGCVVVISDDGVDAHGAGWGGTSRSDAELAVRVRDALRADPLLTDVELRVRADDGVVTLRGQVDGAERFERAVSVAKGIDGVDRVVARLEVEVR